MNLNPIYTTLQDLNVADLETVLNSDESDSLTQGSTPADELQVYYKNKLLFVTDSSRSGGLFSFAITCAQSAFGRVVTFNLSGERVDDISYINNTAISGTSFVDIDRQSRQPRYKISAASIQRKILQEIADIIGVMLNKQGVLPNNNLNLPKLSIKKLPVLRRCQKEPNHLIGRQIYYTTKKGKRGVYEIVGYNDRYKCPEIAPTNNLKFAFPVKERLELVSKKDSHQPSIQPTDSSVELARESTIMQAEATIMNQEAA